MKTKIFKFSFFSKIEYQANNQRSQHIDNFQWVYAKFCCLISIFIEYSRFVLMISKNMRNVGFVVFILGHICKRN